MDQSLSIGENGSQKADEFLDEALKHIGEHRVAFLPFAAEVGSVQEERVNFAAPQSSNGEEESDVSAERKPAAESSAISSDDSGDLINIVQGSMSGEKIEMAKSAARSAAELLGRRDKLGVLAFDGETYVISEMQSARNKGKISDEIARIDAGGGTTMYPAMEMAFEMLLATSAKLKHVILLTDGVSSPGDFEGITQQMVSSKMTLSTVAVGEGSDTDLLESIARIGKGRYYFTTDAAQVPQIFAKETVTASILSTKQPSVRRRCGPIWSR